MNTPTVTKVTDREITPEELENLKRKQLEAGKSYPTPEQPQTTEPSAQQVRKGVHTPDVSVSQ